MIKNIYSIAKKDIIKIFTNYALLIVVIALAIVPSLYAFINIKASWDPYSKEATSRLKVAIVNQDKGDTFNNNKINLGSKIVDNLKKNNTLDWQFMEIDQADEELNNEKIYASIILPEDFTTKIVSFLSSNIDKPKLIYKVNEKINAIAPKITSKGATSLKDTINKEFIGTISDVVLNFAKDIGINVEEKILPKLEQSSRYIHEILNRYDEVNNQLTSIDKKIESISNFIDIVDQNVPKIESVLNNTIDLSSNIDNYLLTIQGSINNISPTIKKDIEIVNLLSSSSSANIDRLLQLINDNSDKVKEELDKFKNDITSITKILSSVNKVLTSINNINSNETLEKYINEINTKVSNLDLINKILSKEYDEKTVETLNNMKTVISDIEKLTSNILDNYDTEISGKINQILSQTIDTVSNINKILKEAKQKIPDFTQTVSNAKDILVLGNKGIDKIEEILPTIYSHINDLSSKIDAVNQNKKITDLIDLITNNVSERVDFLSDPIRLDEQIIFPMGNYGSQMTPFYSVLATYVGLTLLISIFKTSVDGEYSYIEKYFGKLFLFLFISLLQCLVIGLGDIYILKIYCLHPILFLTGLIITSISFTFIVYTLTSVLGNVGKVIAIILMILQVAGSGGTFPVQLTSNFFIKLNPFLPFTYAISFLREAIGGVVNRVLIKDIIVLCIWIISSIIFAVLLKKYINKIMVKFTEKFEESEM